MIQIDAGTVDRVEKILAGIPQGAQKALSNAINRGLSRAKANSIKEIRQVYTVQYSAAANEARVSLKKASLNDLSGYVKFNGSKIPLYKFSVTPKTPGSKERVHAVVKKGEGGSFESAFVARTNKHIGVFQRTGIQGIASRLKKTKNRTGTKHSEKIEEIMGLSVAQMMANENVLAEIEAEVRKTTEDRVEHEISRLLSGYGGK